MSRFEWRDIDEIDRYDLNVAIEALVYSLPAFLVPVVIDITSRLGLEVEFQPPDEYHERWLRCLVGEYVETYLPVYRNIGVLGVEIESLERKLTIWAFDGAEKYDGALFDWWGRVDWAEDLKRQLGLKYYWEKVVSNPLVKEADFILVQQQEIRALEKQVVRRRKKWTKLQRVVK